MITGIGPIGCCPSLRNKNKTDECSEETNYWSAKYNEGLKSMLRKLKSEFKDINYSYFDTYSVLLSLIQNPTAYGTQLFFFLLRNEAKIMSLTKKNLSLRKNSSVSQICSRNTYFWYNIFLPLFLSLLKCL